MSICSACKLDKPEDSFPYRCPGVKRKQCLDCYASYQRSWYESNRDKQVLRTRTRNRGYKNECADLVRKIKEETPCMDCGRYYPSYVMDFDHRDPSQKKFGIGKMKLSHIPPKKLLEEIAKCDVVCANCHRERTWGAIHSPSGVSMVRVHPVNDP